MSRLSPDKAQEAIQFYLHQLGELTIEYAEAADAKAQTEADFRIAWAQCRLSYRERASEEGLKQTESVVDDVATVQTEKEMRARLLAAAKEESTKAALRSTQSKLDGARSLAANLRGVLDG